MRTKKRILSAVLVAAMLVSTIITTVFAADDFTVTAANVTAKAGETVDVTVSIANNPGIIALRLGIGYNSDVLTLTNVKDGGLLATNVVGEEGTVNSLFSDDLSVKPYILYWNDTKATQNYAANGTVATLTFKVADGAVAGDYDVTVTVLDSWATEVKDAETGEQGQKEVACSAVNGKVTVEEEVEPPVSVTGIELDKSELELVVGDNTKKLTATVLPNNADNKTVIWESSDPYTVRVDQEGNLTATKVGTVTITAKTQDGEFTDTCTVTVKTDGGSSGGSGGSDQVLGDIDGSGEVDIDDAILLFNYSMFPDFFPIEYTGSVDFNKDGEVNIDDAILLFNYSMFPDFFPIG